MSRDRQTRGRRQTPTRAGTRSGRRLRALAIAAVIVAAAAMAWQRWIRGGSVEAGGCRGCSVLLVTIDTLRIDRLGAYGNTARLTPILDDLAARGIRFETARTSAPLTLPAHASLLTGMSPPVHGLHTNSLERLSDKLPTLATVLRAAGYRTAAFVSAFVLDARYGLNRGFDEYDDRYGDRHGSDEAERPADAVAAPAKAWIEKAAATRSAWFAWVHFYDPHTPYAAPRPFADVHAPYDAEVAYVDATLGRLLAGLQTSGLLARTLIVVAGDHGESLGDHGERTHGVFTYETTLRVPLIVTLPHVQMERIVDEDVRLIDVTATVLDLLGVAAPPMEGRSLRPAINARSMTEVPTYFEALDANRTRNWAPLAGVADRRFKLIDLPIPELYDLESDPGERANVYSHQPETARRLASLLKSSREGQASLATPAAPLTLTREARERLQALGYVADSPGAARTHYTEADDPKRLMDAANALEDALDAARRGARREAIEAARAIVARHPRFSSAYGTLAAMLRDEGRVDEAIQVIEEAARRDAADPSLLTVLGGYLQEAGRLDRSRELLDTLVRSYPEYLEAKNSLAVTLARLGRAAEARALFEQVLQVDPTSASAHDNLGALLLSQNQVADAIRHLESAVALDARLASAYNALGVARARLGDNPAAIEAWRHAVDLDPGQFDAMYNLGTALLNAGRREEGAVYLERFAATAPPRYANDLRKVRALLQR